MLCGPVIIGDLLKWCFAVLTSSIALLLSNGHSPFIGETNTLKRAKHGASAFDLSKAVYRQEITLATGRCLGCSMGLALSIDNSTSTAGLAECSGSLSTTR